jgi:rfaE bifunctional protein nucleotidyltransferase chain/domain
MSQPPENLAALLAAFKAPFASQPSPMRDRALAKIMDREAFLPVRRALPPGFRLVFTNGCFDILHPGHLDLLSRARDLGDGLVLGLNSDASVRSLGKSPERPLNPLTERAFVLAGLSCVDFVVPFAQSTPLELIRAIGPEVLVKGGDWDVSRIVGREEVEAAGGAVHSLPLLPGFSTTGLVGRIRGGGCPG